MTSKKKNENLSFEQSLQELESIVSQMEQGDLELDQALQQFERGIMLARNSQAKLSEAEQKVKILMQQQGTQQLVDFEQDNQDE
ncbi:exodeoxyribonuclease VII small subunit [Neptunicella sp.]|uniref:exodeoxyribonuclease VII small subunit n=1 Tax=Neptunicella sp. TaxID=2125986 RepID=UPI003F693DD1